MRYVSQYLEVRWSRFYATRVPLKNLFDYVEGGHTLDDFLEGFPGVTREQVIAVLELAHSGLLAELPKG